jgi:hypothetical protein
VAEDRAAVDEGVELAVFAAGVDLRREVAQERFVLAAAGEGGIESLRVHTDQGGLEAKAQDFPGEGGGVPAQRGKTASIPNSAICLSR